MHRWSRICDFIPKTLLSQPLFEKQCNDKRIYLHSHIQRHVSLNVHLFNLYPCGSDGKASAYNAGDPGSIPGSGMSSGEGNGKSTPVLLPGESHGGKSLVGYSPWGRKESDTTGRLHFHFHHMSSSTTKSKD